MGAFLSVLSACVCCHSLFLRSRVKRPHSTDALPPFARCTRPLPASSRALGSEPLARKLRFSPSPSPAVKLHSIQRARTPIPQASAPNPPLKLQRRNCPRRPLLAPGAPPFQSPETSRSLTLPDPPNLSWERKDSNTRRYCCCGVWGSEYVRNCQEQKRQPWKRVATNRPPPPS